MEAVSKSVNIFDRVHTLYLDIAEKVITSQEEYEAMGEYERQVKGLYKEVEAARKEEALPWDQGKQAIQEKYKPFLAKLEKTIEIINQERKKWFRAEEVRKLAEQKRLEEIASKFEQEEKAKLLKKAEKAMDKGDIKRADELIDMADTLHIPAPIIPTKVEQNIGQTMVKVWKARIIDIKKIPQEYLSAWTNPKDIQGSANKFASATKGNIRVAGVEFYEDLIPRTKI